MKNPARSAGGATTLPGHYYTSETIFHEELERIFMNRWICAGNASQLRHPGSYFIFTIGKENVIVTLDENRSVRAFYNICRHRGTRICTDSNGQFHGKIQCPYHAWTYGLDGTLIGAPNMSSTASFDRSQYPLQKVYCHVWEGYVFLNFSDDPEPFESEYEPVLDRFSEWNISELRIAHTEIYDVKANWKILFQNYSECYHCPTVHPLLARLTQYRDTAIHLDEGPFLGGPMNVSGGESMTMDGRLCAMPIPNLPDEKQRKVYYFTLFPNVFLSPHPEYVLVHRLDPVAPDRTRIICEWLFHPEAMNRPDYEPSRAVDFWDLTNRQDWDLCERSQEGVSSRAYIPGPYCDLESMLAAFDREYLKLMDRELAIR
jgi:Rieske 2Fe-2S family protein